MTKQNAQLKYKCRHKVFEKKRGIVSTESRVVNCSAAAVMVEGWWVPGQPDCLVPVRLQRDTWSSHGSSRTAAAVADWDRDATAKQTHTYNTHQQTGTLFTDK